MPEADFFRDAIRRIRSGDEQAAAELVRHYERLIRREVRLHLEDLRLRRILDSMDVTQSVLASFFVRTAAGQYDLDRPDQLVRLLVRMTRNKLASAARKEYQDRRDVRRTNYGSDELGRLASHEPTPSEHAAHRELLDCLHAELTFEERQMAAMRSDGVSWIDIAERLGGRPQARRMQLTRGIERAARSLGLVELL